MIYDLLARKTHIQLKQKGYLYLGQNEQMQQLKIHKIFLFMPHNINVHVWNARFYSFLNSFNYANNML